MELPSRMGGDSQLSTEWNRIVYAIRKILGNFINVVSPLSIVRSEAGVFISLSQDRVFLQGKIKSGTTLARNGAGTMVVWTTNASGGLDSATTEEIDVIDIGQIPAAISPLPANVVITSAWNGAHWVVMSVDCDGV